MPYSSELHSQGEKEVVIEHKLSTMTEESSTVVEEEIDYDAALSLAIQEATAMNPDMTVEKIEIQPNE